MKQIENQVSELVLGFFSKINANVTEKNGLIHVNIPKQYQNLFGSENIKITFDEKIAQNNEHELISPGSNILFRIINSCIDNGPVISASRSSKNLSNTNSLLRFYFYIIFESIKSKTKLFVVNVDMNTKTIINNDDSEINFQNNTPINDISSDLIDDCYIIAMDYIEKLMKPEIKVFKNQIFELKQTEMNNVNREYKKRLDDIQEKSIVLQSNPNSNKSLHSLISKNDTVRHEKSTVLEYLDNKYHISIDFALIAAMVID